MADPADTFIDNLLRSKDIRTDAILKGRSRKKVEPFNVRQNVWNAVLRMNSESPVLKTASQIKLSQSDFPDHLALIPDGNRRWAEARGLSVGEGYAAGAEKIKQFRKWALVDNSVETMSVFLLSTENIERRPEDELEQLYSVFIDFFNGVAQNEFVQENQIRHEVRGADSAVDELPDGVRRAIHNMESATSDFNGPRVVFLIPYGGRAEIVKAASDTRIIGGLDVTEIGEDQQEFRDNLMLGDLPDVDLMTRTSEKRISNFMLYHTAYAEFVFHQLNWPSFTESMFYETIYKYANRDRRFGV